jgi:hypothetical protein
MAAAAAPIGRAALGTEKNAILWWVAMATERRVPAVPTLPANGARLSNKAGRFVRTNLPMSAEELSAINHPSMLMMKGKIPVLN